jgi:hypothetical protein
MKRIIEPLRLMRYSPAMTPLRSNWRTLLVISTKKEMLSDNYGGSSKQDL